MMFKQVKDILALLKTVHHEIVDYYDHLQKNVEKERIKMLLDYFKNQKNRFTSTIERYEKEGESSILDSWIQFTPERSIDRETEDFHISEDITVEQVTKIAIHFNQWLEDLLIYLEEKTSSRRTGKVFASLLEIMKKDKLELSTNNALMRDL